MLAPFESSGSNPSLFITADYELFLGDSSGSIENCLFTPTDRLAELAERFEKRLVLFVDILMYWRFQKEADRFPELGDQALRIKQHLQGLLKRGHYLELHLHTQWLDASYQAGRWSFPSYKRYSLSQLSGKADSENWETILGCVTGSKKLLEGICRETVPHYPVTAFRAGGLCVQPFSAIEGALTENKIKIDSSVAPGLRQSDPVRSYDFSRCPTKESWRFESNECEERPEGHFEELPILSFNASLLDKIKTHLLRRSSSDTKAWGDGRGLQSAPRSWSDRAHSTPAVLTYDYWPASIINRELSKRAAAGWKRFVLLGHPKYLSPFGLAQLEDVLKRAKESEWS